MASKLFNIIGKERTVHSVGNINSGKVRTVNHGAVAKQDLENYSLVKLSFVDGERNMDYIGALTDTAYLLCASEEMYVVGGMRDSFADFYVGKGEKGRVIHLEKGVRFESSNFELGSGVTSAQKGHYAEWDLAKKKFVIKATKPTEGVVLMVVEVDKASTLDGQKCIRYEVQ